MMDMKKMCIIFLSMCMVIFLCSCASTQAEIADTIEELHGVEGKSKEEKREEEIASWQNMTIEEHMSYYENQGMDSKTAMKQVAKDRGVGKREIYQYLHVKEEY